MLNEVQFANARALFNNPNVQIFPVRGAQNRTVGLRVQPQQPAQGPTRPSGDRAHPRPSGNRQDAVPELRRHRQRLAVRSGLPVHRTSGSRSGRRTSPPRSGCLQRPDIERGFKVPFIVQKNGEMPQLAQIMQRSAKAIGVDLQLELQTEAKFFAGTQWSAPCNYGNTPWLNGAMTLTGWGGRSVPNVYLSLRGQVVQHLERGAVQESGARQGDRPVPRCDCALRPASVRASDPDDASRDTPFIFPYFFNSLAAGSKRVRGYNHDASALVYVSRTSLA